MDRKLFTAGALIALVLLVLSACGGSHPSPSISVVNMETEATAEPAVPHPEEGLPLGTEKATAMPTASPTPSPTMTASPTSTATPTPTASPTPTPTATPSPTPTMTPADRVLRYLESQFDPVQKKIINEGISNHGMAMLFFSGDYTREHFSGIKAKTPMRYEIAKLYAENYHGMKDRYNELGKGESMSIFIQIPPLYRGQELYEVFTITKNENGPTVKVDVKNGKGKGIVIDSNDIAYHLVDDLNVVMRMYHKGSKEERERLNSQLAEKFGIKIDSMIVDEERYKKYIEEYSIDKLFGVDKLESEDQKTQTKITRYKVYYFRHADPRKSKIVVTFTDVDMIEKNRRIKFWGTDGNAWINPLVTQFHLLSQKGEFYLHNATAKFYNPIFRMPSNDPVEKIIGDFWEFSTGMKLPNKEYSTSTITYVNFGTVSMDNAIYREFDKLSVQASFVHLFANSNGNSNLGNKAKYKKAGQKAFRLFVDPDLKKIEAKNGSESAVRQMLDDMNEMMKQEREKGRIVILEISGHGHLSIPVEHDTMQDRFFAYDKNGNIHPLTIDTSNGKIVKKEGKFYKEVVIAPRVKKRNPIAYKIKENELWKFNADIIYLRACGGPDFIRDAPPDKIIIAGPNFNSIEFNEKGKIGSQEEEIKDIVNGGIMDNGYIVIKRNSDRIDVKQIIDKERGKGGNSDEYKFIHELSELKPGEYGIPTIKMTKGQKEYWSILSQSGVMGIDSRYPGSGFANHKYYIFEPEHGNLGAIVPADPYYFNPLFINVNALKDPRYKDRHIELIKQLGNYEIINKSTIRQMPTPTPQIQYQGRK